MLAVTGLVVQWFAFGNRRLHLRRLRLEIPVGLRAQFAGNAPGAREPLHLVFTAVMIICGTYASFHDGGGATALRWNPGAIERGEGSAYVLIVAGATGWVGAAAHAIPAAAESEALCAITS